MLFGLDPATLIARLIVLVFAFSIHEFAHAWTATQFGDDTPSLNGRLTLNPLAHLDPMGSLVLLVAGFGWAKPVPVNPYVLQRRSSSAMMWVALAGPLSNFLMAALAAIPFKFGWVSIYDAFTGGTSFFPSPVKILLEFVSINLLLMIFNLIPIAPLDGEKIAYYFFPPAMAKVMDDIRPYGPIILVIVVFVAPFLGVDIISWILGPPMRALYSLLLG